MILCIVTSLSSKEVGVRIGGSAYGPWSQPAAICMYADSVRWMPSQLIWVVGSGHALAPGNPHAAVRL
jgi:hypothetical protein